MMVVLIMLNTIDVDIKETQSADNNVQEKFINEKNYKILETAAEYAGIFRAKGGKPVPVYSARRVV